MEQESTKKTPKFKMSNAIIKDSTKQTHYPESGEEENSLDIEEESKARQTTQSKFDPLSNAIIMESTDKNNQEIGRENCSDQIVETSSERTIDSSKTVEILEEYTTETNYNDSSGETNVNKEDMKLACKKTNIHNKKCNKSNITNIEPSEKFIGNESEMEDTSEYGEPVEIPCDVIIKEELSGEDPLHDPLDVDSVVETEDKSDNDVGYTPNELESIENTQNTADVADGIVDPSYNVRPSTRKRIRRTADADANTNVKPAVVRKRKPRKKMNRKKPRGQNIPPGISKYAGLIANTKLETCNRYQCHQCSSSFSTIYSLNAHLLRHEGKIYACEFCGKTFGARSTLNHHLQAHEGFKYTCDKCPAEFTLKHSWKRHMLIHAGVRYPCFICGKSFSRRTDVNAHLDVHKGFKGTCYHCKKCFANKKSLREHLLIHRGIRYPCGYCDKSYSEKKTIRKHYREKHNIEY